MRAFAKDASNTRLAGQLSQATPRPSWLGLPVRAKLERVRIMAPESCSRPGRLAWLKAKEKDERPKLPNQKGKSIA